MRKPHVGIDLMGGDQPPSVLLEALLDLIQTINRPLHLTLFGPKELEVSIPFSQDSPIAFTYIAAKEAITMSDNPLSAVRLKKEASMTLGIKQLKENLIDAFVTTGNTGALLAGSMLLLGAVPGVERAALLALLPTRQAPMAVLDVGANVHSTSEQLIQFAYMGVAYQKSRGIQNPKVGLLNIGSEEKKGTKEHQTAHQLLSRALGKEFIGNVEGREAFSGKVDVLVTDGFTGNVFLKTCEGVAQFVVERILQKLHENPAIPTDALIAPVRKELNYAEYPGALLCGVEGIVVKCHGNADPKTLFNGITKAVELIEGGFLPKLKELLSEANFK